MTNDYGNEKNIKIKIFRNLRNGTSSKLPCHHKQDTNNKLAYLNIFYFY